MAKIFLYGVQGQYGNYCAALRAAGLEPVLSRDLYRSFDCAGLLLPGGGDIGAALDGTDQFLIESFTETRRPVLGICRGMQAINVYFGGTLHRWIPGHQQPQGDLLHATRTVGPLTALLGPEPVVTSNHHQAVDRLGEGLAVLQRAGGRHGGVHPPRDAPGLGRAVASGAAELCAAQAGRGRRRGRIRGVRRAGGTGVSTCDLGSESGAGSALGG